MGRHPIDSRFAMFVAGAPPVCKALMSSAGAHGSTTTVCRICAWARFWNAAHDGSFVREVPGKPDAGRDGTQHHHSANEDGRSRFQMAHSGPHGLTRCPCSNSVCHVSLVKSCTTSPTLTHPGVWASCRSQCPDWTATGSSLVLVGRCCDEVSDLDLL